MKKLLVGVAIGALLAGGPARAAVEQDNLSVPTSTAATWFLNLLANWDCVSSHTNCNMGMEIMVPGSVTPLAVQSNASSGVATGANNLPVASFLYGFNGTTWDQLQVDASKNLKVNLAGGVIQWGTGTSNNGQLQSPLTLQTTELNALTSANYAISSVAGPFTNSNTGQAQIGDLVFTSGGSITTTAGAVLSVWFLKTDGTNYESPCTSTTGPARAPDAIIPLPVGTSAVTTGVAYFSQGTHAVVVPDYKFKACVYNGAGVALSGTSNTLTLISPVAQY